MVKKTTMSGKQSDVDDSPILSEVVELRPDLGEKKAAIMPCAQIFGVIEKTAPYRYVHMQNRLEIMIPMQRQKSHWIWNSTERKNVPIAVFPISGPVNMMTWYSII